MPTPGGGTPFATIAWAVAFRSRWMKSQSPSLSNTYEWSDGELGGPEDRGDAHGGPSGLIQGSDAEPVLGHGLELDETGWAISAHAPRYETIARHTAVQAWADTQARASRSMWLAGGGVNGRVLAVDDGLFTVQNQVDDSRRLIRCEDVEDWAVESAGGSRIAAWSAFRVPVIEEVEARWRLSHDEDGTPLCSECGKRLDESHSHEPT